jgi:hypothetical protein
MERVLVGCSKHPQCAAAHVRVYCIKLNHTVVDSGMNVLEGVAVRAGCPRCSRSNYRKTRSNYRTSR